jgi:hypothetical protein
VNENEISASPLRVEGHLDASLSRGLWLVKWLLAVPHYIVLAFLWAAFVVTTIVAFFAILFTSRYPRSLFDFNVGVLRWTWRVGFYSYGALGTDRYPPFTLEPVPDYPASLEVTYPERLSRGLVLVKWWLLAIPQYVIVAILVGGASGWWEQGYWGPGLILVLVVFAGVALLFTRRYPRGIFNFVVGLNRWVLRVAVYAGLMTDAYPPFRLDAGESEPATRVEQAATVASPVPAEATVARSWSAGRIIAIIIGCILALISLGLLAAGTAGVVIDQTQRDSDGFLMSPSERLMTSTYALVSESTDVDVDTPDWVVDKLIGTVRIKGEGQKPLFLGIASEQDAAGYLDSVARAVVTEIGRNPDYDTKSGRAPSTKPSRQTFWVASAQGTGTVTLDWDVNKGSWVIVAMNEDGSRAITADLRIGAELDAMLWISIVVLGVGLLFGLGAASLIYVGVRRRVGA